MYRRSPLRSTLRIVCSTGLPTCLPIYSTGVLFGMMPCLTDWLGSAGSFYLKPPTGNLGTRTAIRTTVRPQLAHGRDSQSRPNLSYRRLEGPAKFRPLAARGSAQLLNLVQLYSSSTGATIYRSSITRRLVASYIQLYSSCCAVAVHSRAT